MSGARAEVLPLDAARYVAHPLHRGERAWPESNCYVDLWIEALHALDLDPTASLACALAIDVEGDQWTFFKQPPGDLHDLYGIDVQELSIWRSPAEHALEQVSRGNVVLLEVDAFYLPNTAGTTYRERHDSKTTIGIQEIDVERRRLGYFHSAGYFALSGDDFAGVFDLGRAPASGARMAPYAEVAKLARVRRLAPRELAGRALRQARGALERRPAENPFTRWRQRAIADLEWLRGQPMATFHAWAFATIRQIGAAAELGATFLRWLAAHGEAGLDPAAADHLSIAELARVLELKAARAVGGRRAVDLGVTLDAMEKSWDAATAHLHARLGS